MLQLILLIFALILFLIAAFGGNVKNINLVALGLAFWVGSLLISR